MKIGKAVKATYVRLNASLPWNITKAYEANRESGLPREAFKGINKGMWQSEIADALGKKRDCGCITVFGKPMMMRIECEIHGGSFSKYWNERQRAKNSAQD